MELIYNVRAPWNWVFRQAFEEKLGADVSFGDAIEKENSSKSIKCLKARGFFRTFKCEIVSPRTIKPTTANFHFSFPNDGIHFCTGDSYAFDNLEDKDSFTSVCNQYTTSGEFTPEAQLIDHDLSREDCYSISFPSMPAILKQPFGSQGDSVYFIENHDELWYYLQTNYINIHKHEEYFKALVERKKRIPQLVLQSEVKSKLVRGRKKFHLRTYVVVLEKDVRDEHGSLFDIFIYKRHEVRIAGKDIPLEDYKETYQSAQSTITSNADNINNETGYISSVRDRSAHITNGAGGDHNSRCLLEEVEELACIDGFSDKLEYFVADYFAQKIQKELNGQISQDRQRGESMLKNQEEKEDECNNNDNTNDNNSNYNQRKQRKFAISGVDIMVTEELSFSIIEVNANPAAPPEHVLSDTPFRQHLKDLAWNLTSLVCPDIRKHGINRENEAQVDLEKEAFGFRSAKSILK